MRASVAGSAVASSPHPDSVLLAACVDHDSLAAEEYRLLLVMQSFDVKDVSPPAQEAERAWDEAGDRAAEVLAHHGHARHDDGGGRGQADSGADLWRSIGIPTVAEINFEERGALSALQDLERIVGGDGMTALFVAGICRDGGRRLRASTDADVVAKRPVAKLDATIAGIMQT